MPNFAVNSDETAQTSATLLADFTALQDKLTEVRGKIDGLLANGYSTPAAQQKFQPFFEEFARGFEQVNQGLEASATTSVPSARRSPTRTSSSATRSAESDPDPGPGNGPGGFRIVV